MTSWANARSNPLHKRELNIRSYFSSSSEDYFTSAVRFIHSFAYAQRSAEPFYVYDEQGFFQPLLNSSPILHYMKQKPTTGTNLFEDTNVVQSVLQSMSEATLKRHAQSIFQFNPKTKTEIDTFNTSTGLNKQIFDAGIVLDISGCVPKVIEGLKVLQKRLGKSQMKVFVLTDNMELLREFAMKGDTSWNYVSLMRFDAPTDNQYKLTKMLTELQTMKQMEYLVLRKTSAVGKLLNLLNDKLQMDSQIVNVE